jgi:hypothetical protein
MKKTTDGVEKAFKPYKKQEIELVLSIVPTHRNVKNLAKSLGRTENAIYVIYNLAYSGKWLKEWLSDLGPHQDNVGSKVAASKKKLGIFVGHQPH